MTAFCHNNCKVTDMADKERSVVAYLGPEGSYTHQATLSSFPSSTTHKISPQTTISDVFAAVQCGTASRGVVPFENSSNGSVVFTLDLFADLQSKYPDIIVCGEAYVEVRHCLLGHAPQSTGIPEQQESQSQSQTSSNNTPTTQLQQEHNTPATPLHDLSKITTLYSHPQAWGQCSHFLTTYLKHAERHDVSSTSRAAEIVSRDSTGTSAALSSIIAADLFNLDVLAKTINDRVGNTTRFLVIGRKDSPDLLPSTAATAAAIASKGNDARWKSLVTFTPDNDANPGALANCLSAFSKHGINLTSINTRPSGVKNWNYIFFVEFEGCLEDGDTGAVKGALKELETMCKGYRWLGSWVDKTPA
ncbi:hypothetical protein NX059_002216 [Plenodomus lindquistii]|nr:hypothetical protein NX059_002216 [Plenodomus lindquistii]